MTAPEAPLAGIRVLELGIWIQAPLAAQTLGDLGADVIKLERPDHGDFSRGLTSLYGVPLRGDETGGLMWQLCNRNKRSLAIDLKRPEGQKLLRRLIKETDVFVTNLQPSVLATLGATAEELMKENPRLIYALGTGLAVEGDLADIPCQDTTAMAFSGFMYAVANDAGTPYYPPGAMVDVMAATNLAAAVTAALHQTKATGQGQVVSTSLLHSALWIQMLNVGTIENLHAAMPPFDRDEVANPLMNLYRCGDGKWIAMGMLLASTAAWKALCGILGRAELADDERFKSNRDRTTNASELVPILTDLVSHTVREDLIVKMDAAGLPCTPVHTPEEVLAHPGVRTQGIIAKTKQGTRFLRPPINIEGTLKSCGDAPPLGASTFDVLKTLGMSGEEVSELREAGIVF